MNRKKDEKIQIEKEEGGDREAKLGEEGRDGEEWRREGMKERE